MIERNAVAVKINTSLFKNVFVSGCLFSKKELEKKIPQSQVFAIMRRMSRNYSIL